MAVPWLAKADAWLDRCLTLTSVALIPLAILGLSAATCLFLDSAYDSHERGPVQFRAWQPDRPVSLATASRAVQAAPVVAELNTHRSEAPFWLAFSVSASADDPTVVEFRERHVNALECWNATTSEALGRVAGSASDGILRRSKAGIAISPVAAITPLQLVCSAQFEGPAVLTLHEWQRRAFGRAAAAFERDSGLLDGGLGVLAAFVLVTALINRDWRFVIFAAWLVANMRLAAMSGGWDAQWMGRSIPWEWLIPMRRVTAAAYYLLTTALFGTLFAEDLTKVGHAGLWRLNRWSCLALPLGCLVLPFSQYLPLLWTCTAFTVGVIIFLLCRILVVTRSRVAMWYALSLGVTLAATLNEVLAAAFGFRSFIGHMNSVTAALSSSLIAAVAIAEQMREEHAGRIAAQAELKQAYEVTPAGLFSLSPAGRFTRANAALVAMLGGRDVLGSPWADYFESGAWRLLEGQLASGGEELELRGSADATGARRWYLVKAALADGKIEGSLQDITERVEAIERMRFLAEHDPLTGVLNRRGIEKILGEAVQKMQGSRLSIAYLDLDRFKLLNDLFGHIAGDSILRQVCDRIVTGLAPGQHLGRVGGDEFVIVLSGASPQEAAARCRLIVDLIGTEPYPLEERAAQIKGSIGLLHVDGSVPIGDAISLADRACREAKNSAAGLVIYEDGSAALKERASELRLAQRFTNNTVPDGMFLLMQPIMSVRAPKDSLDFEVLLRMREVDGRITPAGDIVRAAEANGRIAVVDRWVLTTALNWIAQHRSTLNKTRFVCVNLSGGSLNDENFVKDVYSILAQAGAATERLCIEITESVALHDLENTRRFIERTRSYGARIALDDFGAGYTSFSYLRELPADAVKIDGSFVKGMTGHPANLAIVTAIIELARNLGMRSIAEWVEDTATLEALASAGADYVQGYAIGRPSDPQRILLCNSASDLIEAADTRDYVRNVLCAEGGAESDTKRWLDGLILH